MSQKNKLSKRGKKNFLKSRWIILKIRNKKVGKWRFEVQDLENGFEYYPQIIIKSRQ